MYLDFLAKESGIIYVNVSRLVTRVVARSNAVDVSSPCSSLDRVSIVLGSGRESEIHQMGNGGLTSAAVCVPHSSLLLSAMQSFREVLGVRLPP